MDQPTAHHSSPSMSSHLSFSSSDSNDLHGPFSYDVKRHDEEHLAMPESCDLATVLGYDFARVQHAYTYPARPDTSPTDRFTGPRTDSVLSHAPESFVSVVSVGKEGGYAPSEGSEHKFAVGDMYQYNRDNGVGPGPAPWLEKEDRLAEQESGWYEGGKGRKKLLFFLGVVLLLLVVATGVSVGLYERHQHLASVRRTSPGSAPVQGSPSAADPSPTTLAFWTPSTPFTLPSATPVSASVNGTKSRFHSSYKPLSPTASVKGKDSTGVTPVVYTVDGTPTTVQVSYTVPTNVVTRTNGELKFTQAVVLPNPAGGSSIETHVELTVKPTASKRL